MTKLPIQAQSPANLAADLLIRELGDDLPSYTYVDFCAGGGGPTPAIERVINTNLNCHGLDPVDFVLTDLHPNVEAWEKIAKRNDHVTYEAQSVDASKAPSVLARVGSKKTMRLFNLAFHHFDDPLAKDILRNTVETSHGLAIFELQDRSVASFMTHVLFGISTIFFAPLFAWKWKSPATLFFSWLVPILPFVLVFDGYISSLRTRTPDEFRHLLATCGADTSGWEIQSGSDLHLWPCGYLNWIICRPRQTGS